MPLNFPDNPVDNQVYSPTPQKAWVYNASQGTWLASNVSSQGTKVTVQDAAPQGSDQGDLWFNSETGSLNVNYDDTTSEQWVNISSSGIIESEDVINDNTMLTASESTLATSSSIKAYVDDIVGGGLKDPNHAGGTIDVTTSFQDLDLSSIVGSNKAQVTMEAYNGSAGLNLYFRRKGSLTDPYNAGNNAGWGAGSVTTGPSNDGGTVVVVTDSTGRVEYKSDSSSTGVEYKVLTYQVIS